MEGTVRPIPSRASIHDPDVSEPTIHDVADALICLAGLVATGRIIHHQYHWSVQGVDWDYVTNPIIDALSDKKSDIIQRGPDCVIITFTGTIYGINIMLRQGTKFTKTVEPT